MTQGDSARDRQRGLTRRGVLTGAAAFGAGFGVDRLLPAPPEIGGRHAPASNAATQAEPFFGTHQGGITTEAQRYLHFAAFDVASPSPVDLRELLSSWTRAAAALTAGATYGGGAQALSEPPADPGEAYGLTPSRLTITIGFGPTLFERRRREGFGIRGQQPPALRPLPPLRGDALDSSASGGDICVQACAEDPQVAFHAVHLLTRLAGTTASLRWSQMGFGRTSSTSGAQETPRNLMGFKDGTANIRAEEDQALRSFVWVSAADGPPWMVGGSYLMARRIRILFDVWDAATLEEQQDTVGRAKGTGAPLGSHSEYDPVDLAAERAGSPVIPVDAHVRLAHPSQNNGQRILRRGYSYSESTEPGSGQIDAGLFFIAFTRDPRRQLVPMLRRLAGSDALNRHTLHTSSSIFACPSGTKAGGFVGEGLFV